MSMTNARVRAVLVAAWLVTTMLLIYGAGVPIWLALIGNVAGALVIRNYARPFPDEPLSRGERVLRRGAYVLLGAVAACLVLLLVVTMMAFLVAWLAN